MHTKDTTDPLIQRLRQLARTSPVLSSTALQHERILPLLRDADLHAGHIALTPLQIEEKLHQGVPLLFALELDIDIASARDLMIKLADVGAGAKNRGFSLRLPWAKPEPDGNAAELRIKTSLEENRLSAGRLLALIAAGDRNAVSDEAEKQGLDPGLLLILAQNALKPALRAWCRQLSPLAAGISWHRNTCFVCGTPATLAELQGNDQAKHLRCDACGADWQVRRLQCAQCGNEDHKTQHYLYAEGRRDTMRVEVCDVCKGYVKVIASFSPMPVEMITIEDLATAHLDALAQKQGYVRMSSEAGEGRSNVSGAGNAQDSDISIGGNVTV
jgi:FdhE protein